MQRHDEQQKQSQIEYLSTRRVVSEYPITHSNVQIRHVAYRLGGLSVNTS